jgi:Type IV secretion-system coupling protein DNA-binding domain
VKPVPVHLPALRLAAGAGADWLGGFLVRLADRLRAASPREALLIEQWWDGRSGEVRLLPYSEALLLAMEAVQEGAPLAWWRTLRDRACAPPPGWLESWFWVVPSAPIAPRDGHTAPLASPVAAERPEAREDRPWLPAGVAPPAELLPQSQPYWVGVQTHWTTGSDGEVWTTTRGRIAAMNPAALRTLVSAVEVHLRRARGRTSGPDLVLREVAPGRRRRRDWATGARPIWGSARPHRWRPEQVALAVPFPLGPDPDDDPRLRHTVVLGASGSGKTAALAQFARAALTEHRSVVLFDVHGDLAPRVIAGLPAEIRERVIGIDIEGAPAALPGLSVFGPVPPVDREALVAHLVAAFKRLSTENGETFWGFRLERLFETFLHVVQEQEGNLVDLWNLLTDPRRREAARLTTDRPDIAQFLEELDDVVRRQPDFLWPAASRVSKVVGSPLLTALLAPRERPLEVGARLGEGASAFWRLPIGELGPEGVTFAVTLLLTRVYLEQVRRAGREGLARNLRVLFVLDEAHLFPSRLVSESVAEGRKFGLGLVLATQYPARLAPELRDALTGAAGTVYSFRAPWASAEMTGSWAGLGPEAAKQTLPALPPGWAVRSSTGPQADRQLVAMPGAPSPDLPGWQELVRRSTDRYGSPVPYQTGIAARSSELLDEELLLGLVALEAGGESPTRARLLRWMGDSSDAFDPVVGVQALETLVRRGWLRQTGEVLHLAPAGADRVGLTARTGARPESAEHRALLVAALRIFARHHERLEILRQGRFDTRLPDGRVAVLPRDHRQWRPAELASCLDRRRRDWIWRAFAGRDVYVEAEVSGATRRERIERDWEKARTAGAFLLCLVGDAARARSVRRFLAQAGVPRDRATVWTLPSAAALPRAASAT